MSKRDHIAGLANEWVASGPYKPTPDELIGFFTDANTERAPSWDEAQKSLDQRSTGCYVGGQVKHWCGIFACSVARNAGLQTLNWTLRGGEIHGSEVKKEWGNSGIQPGDIAIIAARSHQFIVTGTWTEDESTPQNLITVEGNTSGQKIKTGTRSLSENTRILSDPDLASGAGLQASATPDSWRSRCPR